MSEQRGLKVNDVLADPITGRLWICIAEYPAAFRPAEYMRSPQEANSLNGQLSPTPGWPIIAPPPLGSSPQPLPQE